jgi:hypothetical protein
MNVLLLRGIPSPKRIRGTFLRHEPTRRTCFYAAEGTNLKMQVEGADALSWLLSG